MLAAVMQPTYLPWLGYFAMMDRADVFVFLDSVQFASRSWQQRNRIKTASGELMLSVPVSKKGKRDQQINEVEISEPNFATDHQKTITMAYSRAPFFKEYSPAIFETLSQNANKLADLNIELIKTIARQIGINCEFKQSSNMAASGSKADLIAAICSELRADVYLSALGSREYIEESTAFESRGIPVIYNEYKHPTYKQLFGEFLPYMAAIDLVFNEGPNSLEILRSGIPETAVK